jgi:hypothetical protein
MRLYKQHVVSYIQGRFAFEYVYCENTYVYPSAPPYGKFSAQYAHQLGDNRNYKTSACKAAKRNHKSRNMNAYALHSLLLADPKLIAIKSQ